MLNVYEHLTKPTVGGTPSRALSAIRDWIGPYTIQKLWASTKLRDLAEGSGACWKRSMPRRRQRASPDSRPT